MGNKRGEVNITHLAFQIIVPFIVILALGSDLYKLTENLQVVGPIFKFILPSPDGEVTDFIKIVIDTLVVAGVIELIKRKINRPQTQEEKIAAFKELSQK